MLLVGLSLMTVPVAVMCCFNDDRSLGESSEAKRCELGCFLNICFASPSSGDRPTAHLPWHACDSLGSPHEFGIAHARVCIPARCPCSCCKAPKHRGQLQKLGQRRSGQRTRCSGCCVAIWFCHFKSTVMPQGHSVGSSCCVAELSDAAAGRPSGTSLQRSWRRPSGSGSSTAAAGLHAPPPSSSQPSYSSLTSSAPLRQV